MIACIHKQSIAFHERGKKHQEKVQIYFREKRKEKETNEKEKSELARKLRAMEVAAMASFNDDRMNYDFATSGSVSTGSRGAFSGSSSLGVVSQSRPPPPPPPILRPNEVEGQYTIKGKVYLQGDYYKPLLKKGFKCQAI